jgi:hypothetical protein
VEVNTGYTSFANLGRMSNRIERIIGYEGTVKASQWVEKANE